jgi:transcription elongation factor SPT6
MQLTSSSLSLSTSPASQTSLSENDLEDAAVWVVSKLEHEKSTDFFDVEGRFHHLLGDLYNATQTALKFLFVQHFEVPYIWIHRRDWISYFNPQNMRTRVDFLTYEELWRVQSLGQKYCALIERRKSVDALYSRLEIDDDYFNGEVRRKLDSVEMVADAIEWLNMKYKEHKRDLFGSSLDGGEENVEAPKHKLPSRISAYEVARKSVVSKLADVHRLLRLVELLLITHCRILESRRPMSFSTTRLRTRTTSSTIPSSVRRHMLNNSPSWTSVLQTWTLFLLERA